MGISFSVEDVMMAWDARTMWDALGKVQNALQPYILWNNSAVMIEVVESREHGYPPQSHWIRLLSINQAIKPGLGSVDTVAQVGVDRNYVIYEAVSYLAPAMFNEIHKVLECSQLNYIEGAGTEDWP